MNPNRKINEGWTHAMDRSYDAMKPYLDQFESEKGQLSAVLISAAVMSVHAGSYPPEILPYTITRASAETGIPEDVWRTYADSLTSMPGCNPHSTTATRRRAKKSPSPEGSGS